MKNESINYATEAEDGIEVSNRLSCNESNGSGEKINVERGKLMSLFIYDVTDNELSLIERGDDADIWLNIFIGTSSIAISSLASLFTADWNNVSVGRMIFMCLSVSTVIISIMSFFLWKRKKKDRQNIIEKIRSRKR